MDLYRKMLRDAGLTAESSLKLAMAADTIHTVLCRCDQPTRDQILKVSPDSIRIAREFGLLEELNTEF